MVEVIGSDFGTSNSATVIGKFVGGNQVSSFYPIGLRKYANFKPYPSFVRYKENGQVAATGWDAKASAEESPELTIFDIKRLIGRRFDEPEFQSYKKYLSFDVGKDPEGQIVVNIGKKTVYPEEIAADLMAAMLEDTLIEHPEAVIEKWVVTVPANFGSPKRLKTKQAAMLAVDKLRSKIIDGQTVYRERLKFPDYNNKNINPADVREIKLISEPTAALYSYLAKNPVKIPEDKYVLLFDLGAGTLDITIGKIGRDLDGFDASDEEEILHVHSTYGNNDLGGRRMDESIQQWAENEFRKQGKTIEGSLRIVLKREVEQAKIRLSKKPETQIYLSDEGIGIPISRVDLEREINDLLNQIREVIRSALIDAKIGRNDLGIVILVGGPTQMPCVRDVVQSETLPLVSLQDWDPLLCVAEGAARVAAGIPPPDIAADNHHIAVELFDGCIVPFTVIEKNEHLPKTGRAEIMVQRANSFVMQNKIYLSSGPNGKYNCFNKFLLPSAVGNGTINFVVDYPWKKIQFVQMKKQIPFDFGPVYVDYEITEEGLWKAPKIIDPQVNNPIQFTDIPRGDMGIISVMEKDTVLKEKEKHAINSLKKIENDIDADVRDLQNKKNLTRKQAEEELLTFRIPFEVLKAIVKIEIDIAIERRVEPHYITTWNTAYKGAQVESMTNEYTLKGIQTAIAVALNMTINELIGEVQKRVT